MGQDQDKTGTKQDRTGTKQDRTGTKQDRTGTGPDRTGTKQDRTGSHYLLGTVLGHSLGHVVPWVTQRGTPTIPIQAP